MEPMDYQQQVLTEIVAALGTGPEVTMSEIENSLGQIYAQHANDEWATTLIVDVWAKVNLVASAADNAISLAAAAREVATAVAKQRDEAITAHQDLRVAVDNFDRNHPLVDNLMTGVEEMMMEDIQYDHMYMRICEACNMYEVAGLDVSGEEANIFLGMITDTTLDDSVDPEIGQRLRDKISIFISQIVAEYSAATELWDGDE